MDYAVSSTYGLSANWTTSETVDGNVMSQQTWLSLNVAYTP